MNVTTSLTQLRSIAEKSDLPTSIKKQVILALQYFSHQSQCDLDRRHKPEEIKKRWIEFESILLGTNLLDQFRRNESVWKDVESFVGLSKAIPISFKKNKSRLEGKDADQLIEYLVRVSDQRPVLSATEKQLVQFGLFYLHLEAKRGRGQRDNQRIQFTWKAIQPILRRLGLLEEFDKDPDAVKKLKSFISDRFL